MKNRKSTTALLRLACALMMVAACDGPFDESTRASRDRPSLPLDAGELWQPGLPPYCPEEPPGPADVCEVLADNRCHYTVDTCEINGMTYGVRETYSCFNRRWHLDKVTTVCPAEFPPDAGSAGADADRDLGPDGQGLADGRLASDGDLRQSPDLAVRPVPADGGIDTVVAAPIDGASEDATASLPVDVSIVADVASIDALAADALAADALTETADGALDAGGVQDASVD